MDCLNGSARLMIVSDLDYTMVDHNEPENLALLRFNALWEAYYRHDSLLVFSTGRSPRLYNQLRKEKPMLTPDITVLSVGTEIMYGESMVPDDDWEHILNKKWDRNIVSEETAKFPELTLQSQTEQRPHKVSFYVEKFQASKIMHALSECLEKRGYPPGIFVHPSGFEQPLHQYIDGVGRSYGDKQGTQYRVWLDRVSSAQMGVDTWLVKFDKWELSGEEWECCLTTVLLNSKAEVPSGLRWMHVHQTRLDRSGVKDQTAE